jgi:beta-mannosidase
VLISALDHDTDIDLWVINDSPDDIKGTVSWRLRNTNSGIIKEDILQVCAGTCNAQSVIQLDFSDFINEANRSDHYVEFEFASGGSVLSSGTVLFVKPKDFHFKAPKITLDAREDGNKIYIKTRSEAFAKGVALDLAEADCIFSDNYFDLSAGADKVIEVEKSSLSKELTLEQFTRQLTVNSVYDLQ